MKSKICGEESQADPRIYKPLSSPIVCARHLDFVYTVLSCFCYCSVRLMPFNIVLTLRTMCTWKSAFRQNLEQQIIALLVPYYWTQPALNPWHPRPSSLSRPTGQPRYTARAWSTLIDTLAPWLLMYQIAENVMFMLYICCSDLEFTLVFPMTTLGTYTIALIATAEASSAI
jgi:hypothetical protein